MKNSKKKGKKAMYNMLLNVICSGYLKKVIIYLALLRNNFPR